MSYAISVVIPVYNSSRTLGKCLEAIFKSISLSKQEAEVIVVDDYSTDNSVEIAKKFPCRVARIKKEESHQGPSKPRNAGVKIANGEVIMFIDSDVVCEEVAITRLIKSFEDKDTIAVAGIYSKEPANNSWFNWYISLQKYYLWTKTKETIYTGFQTKIGAIRKSAFEEIGGFDPKFKEMEDYEFGRRLTQKYQVILDKNVQGKHHNPSLKTCIKKYFERSHYWFRLFLSKKKFDNVTTTKSMGFFTGFGFLSALTLAMSLLLAPFIKSQIMPLLALSLSALAIFIYGNAGFYLYSSREKGFLFFIYAIFISYLLSSVIGLGIVYSIITYPIDRLTKKQDGI